MNYFKASKHENSVLKEGGDYHRLFEVFNIVLIRSSRSLE